MREFKLRRRARTVVSLCKAPAKAPTLSMPTARRSKAEIETPLPGQRVWREKGAGQLVVKVLGPAFPDNEMDYVPDTVVGQVERSDKQEQPSGWWNITLP